MNQPEKDQLLQELNIKTEKLDQAYDRIMELQSEAAKLRTEVIALQAKLVGAE